MWKNILKLLSGMGVFVALNSVFIVDQTEQILIVRFGHPIRVIQSPGLHFRVPVIDELMKLDRRLLDYDLREQEIVTKDQERIVVDIFTRYHITDPLKYFQTVQSETGARKRLFILVQGSLRNVLGKYPLAKLLSSERSSVMHEIYEDVNIAGKSLGIDVMDVRIRRADLPVENSQAIFMRMQTQREVMAKELRSIGMEKQITIKSNADRQCKTIIAEAQKKAEVIRGEGEARAIKIYADAFSQDPSFFEFYRTTQAYKTAFQDVTLYMTSDIPFFKFFHNKPNS